MHKARENETIATEKVEANKKELLQSDQRGLQMSKEISQLSDKSANGCRRNKPRHGVPAELLSDRGKAFLSKLCIS